jgi:hypothetical protein
MVFIGGIHLKRGIKNMNAMIQPALLLVLIGINACKHGESPSERAQLAAGTGGRSDPGSSVRESRFWQAKGSETCDRVGAGVLERFVAVTKLPGIVDAAKEYSSETCEISIAYRSPREETSPRVAFNYDGTILIEPKFPLFRFATSAECEVSRHTIEDFYIRGSRLKLISSGCYTHRGEKTSFLTIGGGPDAATPLHMRDFSRIYVEPVREREELAFSEALRRLALVAMTKDHIVYYFADRSIEEDLSTRHSSVSDESIFVRWLDTSAPLLFLTDGDCRSHSDAFARDAFLTKVAANIIDERCVPNADYEKIQLKYLLKLKQIPQTAMEWGWRQAPEKNFDSLAKCEDYLRVIMPDGICSYSPSLKAYAPFQWQE